MRTRNSFVAWLLAIVLLCSFSFPALVEDTATSPASTQSATNQPDAPANSREEAQPAEATASPAATMAPTDPKKMPKPSAEVKDEAIVTLPEGTGLFELPATRSALLMQLDASSVLPVIAVGQTWTKVRYGKSTGYIPTYALSFGYGSPQPSVALVTAPGGKLTLRAEMTTKSKALAVIPSGRAVLMLAKSVPFSLVRYEGQEGYVLTEHLKEVTPTRELGQLMGVISIKPEREANVRLRSEPSRNGAAFTTIKSGLTVLVLEIKDDWARVEYEGYHGYMMAEYLKDLE